MIMILLLFNIKNLKSIIYFNYELSVSRRYSKNIKFVNSIAIDTEAMGLKTQEIDYV